VSAGLLAAVVLLGVGCRRGAGRLEKVEVFTQYHGVTFVEKFKVWATGPDEVIARDAFYEASNYIYDGAAVHLTALRGEADAFQLVVNADYGNVNDVEVAVTALAGPGGAAISADEVSVYFEYYVTLKTPSDYRGRTGAVADALPPLTAPFDLAKGQAQPLFVVVNVSAGAAPGIYVGKAVVTAKGAAAQELRVELSVLDETLDAAGALPPAFIEPDYRAISAWEGRRPGEPVKPEVAGPYFGLLADRRCIPLDYGYSQRRLTASRKKAAGEWAAAAGAETTPTFFYLSGAADDGVPTLEAMEAEYKTLYDAFGEATPTAPVLWPAFAGGAPAPFARGAAAAKWWVDLAAAARGWPGRPKLAAATSPFRGAPDVSLGGAVSVWAPAFRDVALCPERYKNLAAGNEYYIRADGSGGDIIDGRRAGARLLSWYGYRWGAAGVMALAPPAAAVRPRNPWKDDPMVGTAVAYGNGSGCWFYPGAPAAVDGPVSSLRLELLRQGLEDWALFKLLEKRRGRAYVEERLASLLPYDIEDLSDIAARDLSNKEIWELRRAMLEELAGGAAAAKKSEITGRVFDAPGTPIYHARVGDELFACYTNAGGSYRLYYRASGGAVNVAADGFRPGRTTGGPVKLYRGLKGMVPVFDFEEGIKPSFWLSGEEGDALEVAEERALVSEGKVALAARFACGRPSRIVNLYPRQKDFSKQHRFEFDVYNPNDFIVDIWLLLLDDDAVDVARQFRRRISLRPRAWTRVSFRIKGLAKTGEPRFRLKSDGTYTVHAGYRPDLTRVIGVGFESDGLAGAGGEDNGSSYRLIFDNVKVIIFE